jgi:hypothetical protein
MSRKIIVFVLLISSLHTSVGQGSDAGYYIAAGRNLMFDGTFSGLRLAYETFDNGLKDSNCPDCNANRELKFLHAVAKTAMLVIRDNNGTIDSFLELAKTFDVQLTGDFWAPYFYPSVFQLHMPLNQHDAYQIPPDAPDTNQIRAVLDTSIIPEFGNIIDELNSITDSPGDRFRIFLTPDETIIFFGPGSPGLAYDLEMDYGEVLLLKGILTAMKAHLEGQSAYDIAIDANDMLLEKIYGRSIDINDDVLIPRPYLLKVLPTPNYPAVNGKSLLAKAAQDICTAIQYYLDAVAYISSEDDPQDDDFISIDPNNKEGSDIIINRLSTLRSSILNDTVGTYPWDMTKTYYMTDPGSTTTWLLEINYGVVALPACNTGTFIASDSNSAPSPWEVTDATIEGNTIMVEMDYDVPGEWGGALLTGDISQDHNSISNATFEYWGPDYGTIYNMSGQCTATQTQYKHFDANPIFGSSPRYPNPVNPRDLLPQFDQWNAPLPDTMGNGLGRNPTLGGIVPDMNQFIWNLLLNSQPGGLVYLQKVYPWQKNRDGFVEVWLNNNLILDDPASDTYENSQEVQNADIKRLYMAYDNDYLYGAIVLHDYNNRSPDYAQYDLYFSYAPNDEKSLGSIRFSIYTENNYASLDVYVMDNTYGYSEWNYIDSFEASMGIAGVEFRVPWYEIVYLPGRFISLGSYAYNPSWYYSDGEYNHTHLKIGEVGSISGTVSYPDFAGAPIFVQAYTDPEDPEGTIVASAIITAPGPYTLEGIGLGWSGYVRAFTPLFGFNIFDTQSLTIQDAVPIFLDFEDLEDVDLVLNDPILLTNDVWVDGELRADVYESDWFAFDAIKDGLYTLELNRDTAYYAFMTLFARDGHTKLVKLPSWQDQYIDWVCPTTGRYYVRVRWDYDYEPQGGTYQIRMTSTTNCPLGDIAGPQGPGIRDCTVDFYDLDAFCSYWLADCPSQSACGGADFTEDGYVNFADFSALAGNWLLTGPL